MVVILNMCHSRKGGSPSPRQAAQLFWLVTLNKFTHGELCLWSHSCFYTCYNGLSLWFSSVTWSCLTLGNPIDYSTPGFLVHYQLLQLAEIHAHRVGNAIQPSHPLSSPYPPAFNFSQHQGLYQWVSSLHQVAKVLELQHQSFQWIFRTDFL